VSVIDGVLDALHAAPDLRDGLCIWQWDLFDETDDPAAVEHAISLCQQCPVLSRCRDYVESLPPSNRPFGTTAAVCRRPRKPRKETAAA
jgi:hypothetical protein